MAKVENKKKSNFDKVLGAGDILVIAFGAMIGWGWVVSSGDWIGRGGVFGAAFGFVIGGIMIFFVGLAYAELTSAMPQCGGEQVFSHRAFGPIGSFVCAWAIILGYIGAACYEACALPTIIAFIFPDFLQGYLYTIGGFDIYASWLAVAILVAVFITLVNIRGVKTAAIVQSILTIIIAGVGIVLIIAGFTRGDAINLEGQKFVGEGLTGLLKSSIAVATLTPFYLMGFDVIPQAAEEINVEPKKIGFMLLFSIICAVVFYAFVIIAVGYCLNPEEIVKASEGNGLVSATALGKVLNSDIFSKVVVIGGMCGIITTWNAFMMGGSRAMYSMGESYMIPRSFAKLHPKFKTPINCLLLIGLLTVIAPFAGKKMLLWISDAASFACSFAYCMVAMSFVRLRFKEPNLNRPYKIKNFHIVGILAIILSFLMVILCGIGLAPQEWGMVLGWAILGVIFGFIAKSAYKENFGNLIHIVSEEPTNDENFDPKDKDIYL